VEALTFSGKYTRRRPLRVLCLGAHCDDIEIGCGGTLLKWLASVPTAVTTVTLSSDPLRRRESRACQNLLFSKAIGTSLRFRSFRDGFLPASWSAVKEAMQEIGKQSSPDVVFTHQLEDRHQDHRLVAELTWNAFRNHLILEYEIPKYEGSGVVPNLYVTLEAQFASHKVDSLVSAHRSQQSKPWFRAETFMATLVSRGVESNSPSGLAEGFTVRKAVL